MARIAVDEEDLAQEFGTFDIKIQDEDVVDKLKELCMLYRLDASDMADEWMAFSISNNSASLTMDKLEQFERERANKTKTPKVKREKPAAVMHDISNINPDAEDDLLDVYSTPAAKGKNKRMLTTPENVSVVNKKLTSVSRSPVVPFSPGSFSPVNATPSQQYRSRSGAGETMVTFGEQRAKWKGQGAEGVAIQQYDRDNALTEKYKHMFYRVIDKSNVLNDLIEDMSSQLQQSHNMENLQHLAWPCQEPITVSGRVCCDMSTGRLNAHSVLLEGSRETSARKTVHLDLSEVSEYSLFPGQIVACDGLNTTGSKLVVSKFYQGVHLPFAEVDETSENLSVPVQVLVAAGPFTPSDSLAYEPLEDLLKYLKRDQPDVCVLMGPFVDSKHESIEKCTVEVPYDDMFKKIVLNLIKATEELETHLVFVPSQRDVHHEYVYPQPPFTVDGVNSPRVHFVSDPCTLTINGVVELASVLSLFQRVHFVSDPCTLTINGVRVHFVSDPCTLTINGVVELGEMFTHIHRVHFVSDPCTLTINGVRVHFVSDPCTLTINGVVELASVLSLFQRVHFVSDPCTLTINGVRVHFVSDPCTLTINGVGKMQEMTSHFGGGVICCFPFSRGSSDRLGRLIKHILTQQSYYPLYPPSEDVNIDYEHYEQFCRLQATPDVLIIPSDLRYFVKDVLGCVCVNPGRITKAQTGGTFARFVIQCPPSPTQGGAARKPRCTAAEVVRV
ncbi:DNA polymerase alpha subunit B-like [Branchiostoma floridae]|uniref:DNA polymerase alpha subunit B n=1 Tax=Branchiostoma floridae TaxID=7739 RepID=A0A9J7LL66_BRAFL|nr:DNA polymerase alpha subunit B-like [Branchiostoma floridae]